MKARLPQGYGKQNVNDLMRKAQEMQDLMAAKQTELEETEYEAVVGGGMVKVTMNGKHQVVAVSIEPDAIQPDDKEMLEDMLGAAVNEAVRIVDESSEKEMEAIQSRYNIPGL